MAKTSGSKHPQDTIGVDAAIACIHHILSYGTSHVSSVCEYVVTPSALSTVVDCLSRAGRDASWIVLMFKTQKLSEGTDDPYLNLQYSIHDGVVGMEWVLLGERNITDQKMIVDLARRNGHEVKKLELNNVTFLRIEDGDICGLGAQIIRELYQLEQGARIGMIAQGFNLPSNFESAH